MKEEMKNVGLCRTARDSKSAYSYLEGRSIYSKTRRRTIWACNNPIALLEGLEDLLTFGLLQEMVQCAVGCGI